MATTKPRCERPCEVGFTLRTAPGAGDVHYHGVMTGRPLPATTETFPLAFALRVDPARSGFTCPFLRGYASAKLMVQLRRADAMTRNVRGPGS